GRGSELHVLLPEIHFGSVYYAYTMRVPRQRPTGYSTLATLVDDQIARRLSPLSCGDWSTGGGAELGRLGVRYVVLHRALYVLNPQAPDRAWFAWWGLVRDGFAPVARDGAITLFARGDSNERPPYPEPDRSRQWFCLGWHFDEVDPGTGGHYSAFWFYGAPQLPGRIEAPRGTQVRIYGSGRAWHLATILVPQAAQDFRVRFVRR